MTPTQTLFLTHFPQLAPQFDVPLAPKTYFQIGGAAEVLIEPKTVAEVQEIVHFCTTHQVPLHILGGASNVVVNDAGLNGVVVIPDLREYQVTWDTTHDHARVIVGTGLNTSTLVRQTIDDGLTGLEPFLGVPGKLGGAIYNNAHYQNHRIGEYVERVQAVLPSGETTWYDHDACAFGYDDSVFQTKKEVLVTVVFRLARGEMQTSLDRVREATQHRATTQPLGVPSSGCYFRNPTNTDALRRAFPAFAHLAEVPAGFLIEAAGLKGTQVGGVAVSTKHAAFFVNVGQGTAADVKKLAALVQERVLARFGVQLTPEVFTLE